MAQIKAKKDHQGIEAGVVYKIYEQYGGDYYLVDHFNYGRIVQYPKSLQEKDGNEKATT